MLKDLVPSSPGYEVNASSIKAAVGPPPPPGPAGTKLKAYFRRRRDGAAAAGGCNLTFRCGWTFCRRRRCWRLCRVHAAQRARRLRTGAVAVCQSVSGFFFFFLSVLISRCGLPGSLPLLLGETLVVCAIGWRRRNESRAKHFSRSGVSVKTQCTWPWLA